MTDNQHLSLPQNRGADTELLRSELQSAKQALQDREGEIARLKDEQRNPRLLLKQFIKEVRLRLERRASRPAVYGQSLRYGRDAELQAMVADPQTSPAQLLTYLATHDAHNIAKDNPRGQIIGRLRRFFWIAVVAVVKAGYFSAKAVFKGVKRLRHAARH
jgi:hypothetical protein